MVKEWKLHTTEPEGLPQWPMVLHPKLEMDQGSAKILAQEPAAVAPEAMWTVSNKFIQFKKTWVTSDKNDANKSSCSAVNSGSATGGAAAASAASASAAAMVSAAGTEAPWNEWMFECVNKEEGNKHLQELCLELFLPHPAQNLIKKSMESEYINGLKSSHSHLRLRQGLG